MIAPIPATEAERLVALRESQILDTPPDDAYDDLVRLAAQVCGAPIAAVTLVDRDRQWFKSVLGMDARETSRDVALCAHTILQPGILVIPDIQADARFADNPFVTAEPSIRFYAGFPLVTPQGHALGSLCVIDRVPRSLTAGEEEALGILARQVASQIELGRRVAVQERLIAEREQSDTLFRSAIESMQEGFVLQDRSGAIHLLNPRAAEILGLTADQLMGRTYLDPEWRAIRPDGTELPGPEHPAMISLRDGVSLNGVIIGVQKPGVGLIWISINTNPLWTVGEDGPSGVACTFADITESRQAEEERARLAAIVDSSEDAIMGMTVDGTLASWNAGAERLYGYAAADVIGQHASVLAPPEKRGFLADAIRAIRRGERQESIEVRRLRRDNVWMDIALTFSPIRNLGGEITGVAAIGRDVTAQKQALEAVRHSEARLAEAQRIACVGSWEMDLGTARITWSEEMYRIFEFDPAGGPPNYEGLRARYHPDDLAHRDEVYAAALAGGTSYQLDLRLVLPSGQPCWCQAVGRIIRDMRGEPVRVVGTAMDITERKKAEQALKDFAGVLEFQKAELETANAELARLATVDGLTGLHNRRAFDERLRDEFERATRYGTALSLLLLDIDHFKQYNDAFGHPEGDEVLRRAGRVLNKGIRETDFVARYGGEEIALILPETDGDGAMVVAERIRLAIATADWDKREVTISVGATTLRLGMNGLEDMLVCADRALYRSKEAGRDRVTHGRSLSALVVA